MTNSEVTPIDVIAALVNRLEALEAALGEAEARAKQAEQERDEARKWATTMEHERDWERDVVQSEMRSRIEAFEAAAAEIIDAAERGQEHEVDEALSLLAEVRDDRPFRGELDDRRESKKAS